MFGIINLISTRLNTVNYHSPFLYLDVLLSACLIFGFLFYVRRYPVFRVFLGIGFLLFCSLIAYLAGFIITSLVFGVASNLILISLPLIFAPEIRHYLEKLGHFPFLKFLKFTGNQKNEPFVRNLIEALFEMAEKKIGATVVLQRRTGLGETLETGIVIDARFGSKLLQNIFFPKSPLHDGAVVMVDGRITAAGCLLPISSEVKLDSPFGTRHKSAVAITKDTDALAVIVSEQRGEVSLAENGRLHVNLKKAELADRLNKLL